MKRIEGYSNRQVRLLDAMSLYCDKIRTIDEIMAISGLNNKEKTLMHLRDLYQRGFITKFTAETGSSDEIEIYYLINDAGKAAFDKLFKIWGEEVLDESMAQAEMEDSSMEFTF